MTVNQEIDYDTAEEIAMEFEVLCEKEEVVDVIEELLKEDEEDESKMKNVRRLCVLWGMLTMVKLPFWMQSVIQM